DFRAVFLRGGILFSEQGQTCLDWGVPWAGVRLPVECGVCNRSGCRLADDPQESGNQESGGGRINVDRFLHSGVSARGEIQLARVYPRADLHLSISSASDGKRDRCATMVSLAIAKRAGVLYQFSIRQSGDPCARSDCYYFSACQAAVPAIGNSAAGLLGAMGSYGKAVRVLLLLPGCDGVFEHCGGAAAGRSANAGEVVSRGVCFGLRALVCAALPVFCLR